MKYQIINDIEYKYWKRLTRRFYASFSVDPDCWNWRGPANANGYGRFSIKGKWKSAHRMSYELFLGPIGNYHVCHSCDNPLCINPDHLFLGSILDNTRDSVVKGRRAPQGGERNGNSKLSQLEVEDIRAKYIPYQVGYKKIAKDYGVTYQAIYNIIKRKTWA